HRVLAPPGAPQEPEEHAAESHPVEHACGGAKVEPVPRQDEPEKLSGLVREAPPRAACLVGVEEAQSIERVRAEHSEPKDGESNKNKHCSNKGSPPPLARPHDKKRQDEPSRRLDPSANRSKSSSRHPRPDTRHPHDNSSNTE